MTAPSYHIPAQKTQPQGPRAPFQPSARGSLAKALDKPGMLTKVAPESPRPVEMLTGVSVSGPSLSSFDHALHDLLVSNAYENDKSMEERSYSIPMRHALRYLGTDARREAVQASLDKMRDVRLSFSSKDAARRYAGVPMTVAWREIAEDDGNEAIGYQFPEPIHALMRRMPRYAYIELAAVGDGRMSSKYSQALYRYLAAAASEVKWSPDEDATNSVTVSLSPDELADVVGFPRKGPAPFGKLQERVLRHVETDFAGVRRFRTQVEIVRKPGRGRPVTSVDFHLQVAAPSHYVARGNEFHVRQVGGRVGGTDDARFRVRSNLWIRAVNTFTSIAPTTLSNRDFFDAWSLALKEALDAAPLTDGYHTRRFRGPSLLAAVDADGADAAAWGFLEEEAHGRDLIKDFTNRAQHKRIQVAHKDRLERSGHRKSIKDVPPVAPVEPLEVVEVPIRAPQSAPKTLADCATIEIDLDADAFSLFGAEAEIERVVLEPLVSRSWSGDRNIELKVKWHRPDRSIDTFALKITPTAGEWRSVMRSIDSYIDGAERYL